MSYSWWVKILSRKLHRGSSERNCFYIITPGTLQVCGKFCSIQGNHTATYGTFSTALIELYDAFRLSRKTKEITTANQTKGKYSKSQWELKVQLNCLKRGKTRATKSSSAFVFYRIVREDGASCLDQSQIEVKQKQCNFGLLSTLNYTLLCFCDLFKSKVLVWKWTAKQAL